MPLKAAPDVRVTSDKFIELPATFSGRDQKNPIRLRPGVREDEVEIDLGQGVDRETNLDELIQALTLIKEGI